MLSPYRKLLTKTAIVKGSKSEAAAKMSMAETAGRAALTATVTFAVGWVLKKMFEKSVEEKTAPAEPKLKPSSATHTPPSTYHSTQL